MNELDELNFEKLRKKESHENITGITEKMTRKCAQFENNEKENNLKKLKKRINLVVSYC